MSGYDPSWSQWCPPELTAASVPLHRTGQLLRALSQDARGLERLGDRGPDPKVRGTLAEFVEHWDLMLWKVSGTAHSLSDELRRAAEDYVGSEADIARKYLIAHPDHEGRRR